MTRLLEDQVVVVTGGASGLGRAICVRVAEEGAMAVIVVDLLDLPREGGETTVDLVRACGAQSELVRADVSKVRELTHAIGVADRFGGVTTMVNNAGIFRQQDFLEVTEEDYAVVMDINVKGTFFGAQAAARSMVDGGRTGSIINMSSMGGLLGGSLYSTYNTSKGAVRLLTYSLAASLGPRGIRVNAVHPGIIETEMTSADVPIGRAAAAALNPLQRNGRPRDVADTVVFLASPWAAYINGASISVDGGASTTSGSSRLVEPAG